MRYLSINEDWKDWDIPDLEMHISLVTNILEAKKAHLRWETGFRKIAGMFVGSRDSFEIDDIVERVRQLSETYPTKQWCECYKKEAWPDECGGCDAKV